MDMAAFKETLFKIRTHGECSLQQQGGKDAMLQVGGRTVWLFVALLDTYDQ